MIPILRRIVPLFSLAAALAAPACIRAQSVAGRLVESGGAPVERVLVVLVDTAGREAGAGMTDASGAFTIRAPGPGRYALRAERIGFQTVLSPAFDLSTGETRQERLVASGRAIVLQGVTATAQARRCAVRPREGLATATLWEEARKALNATAFAQHQRLFRYDIVRWERDLDLHSQVVLADRRASRSGTYTLPFVSAPPDSLSRAGYVRRVAGDTLVYFAPDADVLLSDRFLDEHCFRVADASSDSLVGLAFEPVGGRRVADVRGVLWLERGTARLRRLEYTYANGPPETALPDVGGTVEFAPLPDGPWIVRRWAIRMPIARPPRETQYRWATQTTIEPGIRESGGEVTAAATSDAPPVVLASSAPAFVEGVAWDSTRQAPIVGARVFLSGTGAEAVTDSAGRFHLAAPVAGRYTLAFADTAGAAPLLSLVHPTEVEILAGQTTRADLAIPSIPTVTAALCGGAPMRARQGIVVGRVTGFPPETQVVAGWTWYLTQDGHLSAGNDWARSTPDADGSYVLCGVSEDWPVTLSLRDGRRILGQINVRVDGLLRQDLEAGALAGSVR